MQTFAHVLPPAHLKSYPLDDPSFPITFIRHDHPGSPSPHQDEKCNTTTLHELLLSLTLFVVSLLIFVPFADHRAHGTHQDKVIFNNICIDELFEDIRQHLRLLSFLDFFFLAFSSKSALNSICGRMALVHYMKIQRTRFLKPQQQTHQTLIFQHCNTHTSLRNGRSFRQKKKNS